MRPWEERAKEIAYLFNPAFCGRLLYSFIKEYNKVTEEGVPFPLIYLILPLILHRNTRDLISSRTKFLVWINRNPSVLINFPNRAKSMVEITNEAVELLLLADLVHIKDDASFEINKTKKSLNESKYNNEEIKDCINKSKHVARWFSDVGKCETIYITLGVRP